MELACLGAAGRRIRDPGMCLTFLSIYGPVSVMILLIVWASLVIFAFALIDYGLGSQFRTEAGPVKFGGLIYMSASTFLTLGLGDVTSTHPFDRFLVMVEAATGFIFLGLIITYMPLLDQAYSSREVGSLLIMSRAGSPPNAIRLLRHYTATYHHEVLRGNLREGERWMAEVLQSHLSHPVVAFYRAQQFGQSWLVSLTTVLDTCSLLIVGGQGLPGAGAAHLSHGPSAPGRPRPCPGSRGRAARPPAINRRGPAGHPHGPDRRGARPELRAGGGDHVGAAQRPL